MRKRLKSSKRTLAVLLSAFLLLGTGCFALAEEGLSGDDSLQSLGITTRGVTIDPDFYYSTIEYEVMVPAGTEELSLNPVPSSESATVSEIKGTELDEDGEATVEITVVAEDESSCTYFLYVSSEDDGEALRKAAAAAAQTETETESETETETETETEDSRYVSVARDTLEEAEDTIDALKDETTLYRDRVSLLTKILYVLIGLAVILLFVVINLLLRNRDIKSELNDYQGFDNTADQSAKESLGEETDKKKRKKKKKSRRQKEAEEEEEYHLEDNPTGIGWEDNSGGMESEDNPSETEPEPEDENTQEEFSSALPLPEKEEDGEESAGPLPAGEPHTLPNSSETKTREKRMPRNEKPRQKRSQESPGEKDKGEDSGEVKVDFIDL